jgi:hypothetical protein
VSSSELAFVLVLTALLLGLAGYFGWRQVQTLRSLRSQPADDRPFLRRQAIRRLVCSALMLVLAGLLVGSLLIEPSYQEMAAKHKRQPPQGPEAVAQEDWDFARFFAAYWMAALLVLFVLLLLAGADFWAIARFGARHRRQLQADHRAGLKEELARLRRRYNGDGE